ncbi:sensor histidine kinase [Nocardia sp. CA2R105]|uniref:sensor histidine kinase n=1 Tax=Nocardia coffeae TaxID=2873381 RepID=UPI001CA7A6EF|nr:sensor histidine kinase [Nocardia coffeae]MBY8860936.1 sensor histidine kinase [Nocardia coffeae]
MRRTVRQAARATLQLADAAALAIGNYLFITILLLTVAGAVVVVGIGIVPVTVTLVRRFAGAKRRQVTAWTGTPVPEAYQPIEGALRESLRAVRHDPTAFSDLRWMVAYYVYGLLAVVVIPLWIAGILVDGVWCGLLGRTAVVLPLISRVADLDAEWSRRLLQPPPKALLAARVAELTQTRAGAIAAHEAELRRIERDLHDGTQARLVSLGMRIGLAGRALDNDPIAARTMLDHAQQQVEQALAELRHIVRGIHPPILTDRGLPGAVRALAADNGLEVTVDADRALDTARAPAALEAAAYFVVAEALTNAAKHSGARHAEVTLTHMPRGLRVSVCDDGIGGAQEKPPDTGSTPGGSGLAGMRRRIAALDGTFSLTSPGGGPTVIEVELPCVW